MPKSPELHLDESPSQEDLEILRQGLTEHALSFVDEPGFRPLAVFARARARLVGGVYGPVCWNWLDVSLLWVESTLRGGGLGSRLLRAFEEAGMERGCRCAHLETFSYQARDFYQRHGYRVFAELPDYPPGRSKLFMQKRL